MVFKYLGKTKKTKKKKKKNKNNEKKSKINQNCSKMLKKHIKTHKITKKQKKTKKNMFFGHFMSFQTLLKKITFGIFCSVFNVDAGPPTPRGRGAPVVRGHPSAGNRKSIFEKSV